jgi:hypothetical protein
MGDTSGGNLMDDAMLSELAELIKRFVVREAYQQPYTSKRTVWERITDRWVFAVDTHPESPGEFFIQVINRTDCLRPLTFVHNSRDSSYDVGFDAEDLLNFLRATFVLENLAAISEDQGTLS